MARATAQKQKASTKFAIAGAVLLIFLGFIAFIKTIGGGALAVTGNAVVETGSLNTNAIGTLLVLLSVYAIIVCSFMHYKSQWPIKSR